jgi:hypothetical protein
LCGFNDLTVVLFTGAQCPFLHCQVFKIAAQLLFHRCYLLIGSPEFLFFLSAISDIFKNRGKYSFPGRIDRYRKMFFHRGIPEL